MHQDARQYKETIREANIRRIIRGQPPFKRRTVEMDNFQDPQISSHKPLVWEFHIISFDFVFRLTVFS